VSEADEQMTTVVLLRKLVREGSALAAIPRGGGKGWVGDWWRALSDSSRRAHFGTFKMASHYVDLQNGAKPSRTFDDGPHHGELSRLERAMLDAASVARATSAAALR
jgi:hypothetical protein